MRFQRVKGTRDILPTEALARRRLEQLVYSYLNNAGFMPIYTPTFEYYELYQRTTGNSSDIVIKEMYRFNDMGGRDLALRPEGTPSIMRAVIENKIKIPVRLWYMMSMFRQDKPQKGRYREHTQIGVEIIGEAEPEVDAELIRLGYDLLTTIGIEKMHLEINTIGCRQCRPHYTEQLKLFLKKHRAGLCDDCKLRMERNPLRVFDCKVKTCQTILISAPSQRDYLCDECASHFQGVKKGLDQFAIPYKENIRLVRGLDYYSRTVIEFVSAALGAQSVVCGGGRYDYLMQELGGPSVPAVGFAFGVERALLASQGEQVFVYQQEPIPLLIIPLGEASREFVLDILFEFRKNSIFAVAEFRKGNLSRQLRRANSRNVSKVLIVGEDEIKSGKLVLRDMRSGEQKELTLKELIDLLGLKKSNIS